MPPRTKTRRKARPAADTVTGQLRAVIAARRLTAYAVAASAGVGALGREPVPGGGAVAVGGLDRPGVRVRSG